MTTFIAERKPATTLPGDEEYEFFYCFRGAVQLWAEDESRILRPGDFGYVPPGTMSAPGGLERPIATAGTATHEHIFGDVTDVDPGALRAAAAQLDVAFA